MATIRFQWDEKKNTLNIKKHKISFEEARTVFFDENARLIPDPEHSVTEERYIMIGFSNKLNMLVIVHIYKENEEIIRIISARKATKKESNYYNMANK